MHSHESSYYLCKYHVYAVYGYKNVAQIFFTVLFSIFLLTLVTTNTI